MSKLKEALKIYAVTDSALPEGFTLAKAVEEAILGGATMVQYREKTLDHDARKAEAGEILGICRRFNVPFIVNDDPYLAREIDADGVHLGQDDMPVQEARALLGEGKIIGITAKTPLQAQEAESNGADYLGSGAVFGSTTKANAKKLSLETLAEITRSVHIPVVAIGGINAENVTGLTGCGIAGVAVVSGIFAGPDVRGNAAKLHELVTEVVG